MKLPLLYALGMTLLLCQNTLFADDKKTEEAKKETPPVILNGTFESTDSTEIKASTEQFKSLVIKDFVAHGTKVTKGDKIVSFESDELDEKLAEAETALELANVSMEETEFDFKQFQETQRLDREAAQRTWQLAQQAYDNYAEVDRQQRIKSAEYSLKSSRYSLENAMEELKQLEQMYKEDELTEESEEIVLKRAKRAVESAKFRLESSEIQTKRTIDQTIPAETAGKKETLARAEITYDKAKTSLKIARQKREIEFNTAKEKLEKQEKDFNELREDRKKLVVLADRDGIVYHGKLTRGRLSEKPSALAAGSKVTNEQVLATLTGTKKLQIRVDLAESMLQKIHAGSTGVVTPAAIPDLDFKASVKSISSVPFSKGKFDCVFSFGVGKEGSAIVPGMSCTIALPPADDAKEAEEDVAEKKDTAEKKGAAAKKNGVEKKAAAKKKTAARKNAAEKTDSDRKKSKTKKKANAKKKNRAKKKDAPEQKDEQ